MANGRLGAADLAEGVDTSVYTVPETTFSVVTVAFCNRSASPRNIRLAMATSGTPTNADYLEYDVELLGYGVVERTGIVADTGKQIVVRSDDADVTCIVMGLETATE